MRRYETIFILRPNCSEEEITRITDSTTQIIEAAEGTVIELNRWGMKKLAYLIKKEGMGFYVFCDYTATPAAVSEVERRFRIDDAVLKYMTVKIDGAMNAEKIALAIAAVSVKATASEDTDENTAAEEGDDTPDEDNSDN